MESTESEQRLGAVSAIGDIMAHAGGLDDLFSGLVPELTRLMQAERSTLFLYDEQKKEIWSKVAQGENLRTIRLPLGKGIAGWVAAREARQGKPLNIEDAYQDQRFDPSFDQKSGFRRPRALPLLRCKTAMGDSWAYCKC